MNDMTVHIEVYNVCALLERMHIEYKVLSAHHIRIHFPNNTVDLWPTKRRYHRIDRVEKSAFYSSHEEFLNAEYADSCLL